MRIVRLTFLAAILLSSSCAVAGGVWNNTPASAETICPKDSGNTALVVIDMQRYFSARHAMSSPANETKIAQVVAEQAALIKRAEAAGIPIIVMEYDLAKIALEKNQGDTNAHLQQALGTYKPERIFRKSEDSMFDSRNVYRKPLLEFMQKYKIGKLIVTGANGGACVKKSIQGALAGNCSVVAYTKGIADFNYPDFIYPYVGQYKDIKAKCDNCTFAETSSVDDLAQAMIPVTEQPQTSWVPQDVQTGH
jgi:nicotinamidase-related amidase